MTASMPNEIQLQDQDFAELNQEASDLYGLIHRRYIETSPGNSNHIIFVGLGKIYQKYLTGTYGNCQRVYCDRQKLLPLGFKDQLRMARVKVYCPKCEEIYLPKQSKHNAIDGAYFGTSLPHIFMMTLTEAIVLPPKVYYYEPQISGFKVFGKRGSLYHNPTHNGVQLTEDKINVGKVVAHHVQEEEEKKQAKYEEEKVFRKDNKKGRNKRKHK